MSEDELQVLPDVEISEQEDDNEDHDAGDEGEVVVDDDTAEQLFLEACREAAEAGF